MPLVYAKARNNDPAVPFNSREKLFAAGRGYAVDIRVRDYNGTAAERYAEGVIIGFWESAAVANRIARAVNAGEHYGPGHHFHGRAHDAIVVPAWNASLEAGEPLPWETREGSAEMVAAYHSAGVPLPSWLLEILARLNRDDIRVADDRGDGGTSNAGVTESELAEPEVVKDETRAGSREDVKTSAEQVAVCEKDQPPSIWTKTCCSSFELRSESETSSTRSEPADPTGSCRSPLKGSGFRRRSPNVRGLARSSFLPG